MNHNSLTSVCRDARNMAKDVMKALSEILSESTGMNRYHVRNWCLISM